MQSTTTRCSVWPCADYGFADGVECDVEGGDITRMCDACTLNHILGCALYTPQWPGDSYAPSFHDALGRFVPGIDTRFPIEGQFRAFARFGLPTPPRAGDLRCLMVDAATRRLETERCRDESMPESERQLAYGMTIRECLGLGTAADEDMEEDMDYHLDFDIEDDELRLWRSDGDLPDEMADGLHAASDSAVDA